MDGTAQGSFVVELVAALTETVAILTWSFFFATLTASLTSRLFGTVTAPVFVQRGGVWGLLGR
jgi:hypothetical protein